MATKNNREKEPDIIERKRPANKQNDTKTKEKQDKNTVRPQKTTQVTPAQEVVNRPNPDSLGNQVMIFVMVILSIFFAFCILLTDMSKGVNGISGPIGYYTCKLLYGAFGYGAWFIPLVFVAYALFWKKSIVRNILVPKIIIGVVALASFSTFIQVVGLTFGGFDRAVKFWDLKTFWNFISGKSGGGIIGGFFGGLLYAGFKTVSLIVMAFVLLTAVMLMFEITPARLGRALLKFIRYLRRKIADSYNRAKERHIAEREEAAREAAKLEEVRLAAEKEEKIRIAKEKADREKREREEKERLEKEKKVFEDVELESDEPSKKADYISYYDSQDKKPALSEAASKEEVYKKTVEITPVDMEEIENYKTADDVRLARETLGEEISQEDVKKIFSEDNEQLPSGEFIPPSEKEYDIDGNELRTEKKAKTEKITPEASSITPNKFDELPIEIMEVERESVLPELDIPTSKPYELPPIDLLSVGEAAGEGDSPEELEANAKRLVEVLRSFKVEVEVVHISHGPTITRYEVAPKAGVKVRSISGLVDDIALNMKTSGVRIEPIPGKVAVGIEVPNRCRATVFLRNLIDTDQFRNAKSKVACALGVNIAGEPVLLDIAKMPHLLIAGATGMGKSVCINSLLVSLLYRAKPDEVKLILVDPKKVELNVYNKLPHLLVPVLNAPQKAAGALAWAVIEMERRFTLIEQYGVRNLAGYNAIVAQCEDGEMEYLPHIVIVIDELADLMMQAGDEVEDSICRLAAKARAAGMHMILGTQRPSVDVITGLIKANIPSRIAFTVASNADSRTIIDVAGAEKLIGRGDMLYAPVQEMKALRLQGAFVSDDEVERVVEFIKDQCEASFDADIIEEIEEQAALCGEKKKKGGFGSSSSDSGSDDGELDPKFFEAVELAVDEHKISTSLIQRKLSLGYGRAAKIIDEMEKRGIVSAPDGQKPRMVLISQQDYYEMRIRQNMADTSGYSGND